jgi:hypothetical protein
MMEAARTSEMLVNFYQTTWRYNPEDSHLLTNCHENLKSYYHFSCSVLAVSGQHKLIKVFLLTVLLLCCVVAYIFSNDLASACLTRAKVGICIFDGSIQLLPVIGC